MKVRIGVKVAVRMEVRDMFILNARTPEERAEVEAFIHDVGLVVEEYHAGGAILYRVDFDADVDGRSVWVLPQLLTPPTDIQEDHTRSMFV